ncbi:protein-glutamate methylesterase/protein-glutamine glutaminase [Alkaliphilus hydrothermalis]|uniref:Protein-glutamate methylesterase/protein-glutamine glutaminase n=1 Tax=Alkaliphilus hydrothermalis TaxID=1482730 RepID=A0ABS2NL61_9FIRM|nr:chemotaxis response regulator protein-glutamate methylesterase [Alkaliphilus hydrothermalis]MBM7613680.1 two-component system chemotaxis response regulator CheB [Alkaliphilus hydrothermalis]
MRLDHKPIKVLIVDDSAFMRKILSDMLSSDPEISIVGIARNGQEAIEKVQLLKPDIVTMDVEMPIMNGLNALKHIMATNPLPVVMLSSLTSEGADATIMALEAGAVDFIQKPSSVFMINADAIKNDLVEKIKVAANANCKEKKTELMKTPVVNIVNREPRTRKFDTKRQPIVAIGTSTGGPRALQSIIPLIPPQVSASFLVVQHMPPGFTKSLADRLNAISQIPVKEATDGEKILPATVYIAPGDRHLEVMQNKNQELYIHLNEGPPVSGHRPSVDAMYQSIMNIKGRSMIGVIMTGMGADGAKGLKQLKEKSNSYVIAQDEASCVVYGMPKSAVKLGVVDEILPLEKIINSILNRLEVL